MRRKLALSVAIALVLAAGGVGLYAAVKQEGTGGQVPSGGSATAPAPTATPSDTARAPEPRPGRVLSIDAAARELDLIRPARQKLAEDFTVPLMGGARFRLSEQRGRLVMINFWATWCPPCREEMPAMERLWEQHKDAGFVMVAVSVDSDSALVPPFVAERKFTFPIALDPKMDLANAYGVRALPSSFLVDRKGYLVALALGPRAWDGDAAHSLIEGLAKAP